MRAGFCDRNVVYSVSVRKFSMKNKISELATARNDDVRCSVSPNPLEHEQFYQAAPTVEIKKSSVGPQTSSIQYIYSYLEPGEC